MACCMALQAMVWLVLLAVGVCWYERVCIIPQLLFNVSIDLNVLALTPCCFGPSQTGPRENVGPA